MSGPGTDRAARAAPAPRQTIVILDILRWMSALEVVLGHVRDLLFVDYRNTVDPGLADKLFYFATSFGDEAVIIFFVLSGYLVGGKIVADRRAGRFAWDSYLIDRFSRIYIVLIPALLLTLLCDRVGAHAFADAPIYAGGYWSPAFHFDYVARGTWPVLACNMANLQFVACPAYGSNGPLWSLAMEWAYYLSFPTVLMLLSKPAPSATYLARIVLALLVVALGWRFARETTLLYPVWLMGIAARAAGERVRLGWPVAILAALALAASLPASRYGWIDAIPGAYAIGASLSLLISCAPLLRMTFAARANRALADFSYSLYAAHFPLVVFLLALLQHQGMLAHRVPLSLAYLPIYGGIVLVIYGATYLVSRVTEHRTGALRGWLRRRFAVGATPAPR